MFGTIFKIKSSQLKLLEGMERSFDRMT